MSATNEDLDLQVQARDLQLLRGLLDCRLMTLAHAAAIHFQGHQEAAKKRIQKLKTAGLIGERARKPYEPSILFLTRQGFALSRERGHLHDLPDLTWPNLERRLQVSDFTLRHELEVLDVKAAFSTAARDVPAHLIAEFMTWPLLCEFTASPGRSPERLVKPDGFIRIEEEDSTGLFEHVFFFELDRSMETLDTLVDKARCYLDYYQRGGLAVRFGRTAAEYKEFPFRVLIVLKSAERRNNLAQALLTNNPPIYTLAWLSTFEEVTRSPFGPIWVRPRDYATAVGGSAYPVARPDRRSFYRRQADRERFVESVLVKQCLFKPEAKCA